MCLKNAAIDEYYTKVEEALTEKNLKAIAMYEFIGKRINPLIAVSFVISYW